MPRKPSQSVAESATESRNRLSNLAAVAAQFSGAKPIANVLRKVEAVPTIFPHIDYRVGVGGFPISRIVVIHGPSNEGKTTLLLGLFRSFLERGHFANFVDGENSTPEEYARQMIGPEYDNGAFTGTPVEHYDQVREHVRDWAKKIASARDDGLIPPETTGITGIDSLKVLLPKTVWDELGKAAKAESDDKPKRGFRTKQKKAGMDGMGGRIGQMQAAYNATWFIELTSLLASTRMAFVAIAREDVIEGEGPMDRDVIEPLGGKAVKYDPSLRLRVRRRSIVEEIDGERKLVGEQHIVQIHKTKLSGKDEVIPECYFHTSNGTIPGSPDGFDRARDLFALGLEMEVINRSGAWYSFEGERIGQGEMSVLKRFWTDAAFLNTVERACRLKFRPESE